ncbi:MAG: response regulator [Prolixibacteraceae bacterium]
MTTETDLSNLSLLVADDNPVNRRIVTLLLKGHLREVDVAFNGSEALSKFMQKPYDVILMDINMPDMNGYEATAAIRMYEAKNFRHKKSVIIALTASEEGEVIANCYDSGMDAYLGKPFLVQQLFELIKKLV